MGRRPKGAPNPVIQLGKKLEDVIFEWECEGEILQVRHVASGGAQGTHVRLVKVGASFDRELSRVFLAHGWAEKHLIQWGQAAFELTFPIQEQEGVSNAE